MNKIIRKQINANVLHTKSTDKVVCIFGYATIFGVADLENDIIHKGAFSSSLKNWHNKKSLPFLLWQHDISSPIGKWIKIAEDKNGLAVQGNIYTDTSAGHDAYVFLKNKVATSLSIAFELLNSKSIGNTRHIYQVNLVEISVVLNPAHPEAKILDFQQNTSLKKMLKFHNLTTKNTKHNLYYKMKHVM